MTTPEAPPYAPDTRSGRHRTAGGPSGGRKRALIWGAVAVATVIVLLGAFVGTAFYTDQPGFCRSCHEMEPYYQAWASGPHKDTWCVDCHVGKSYAARLAHKFAALGEVASHFRGDTSFPRPTAADVANRNCEACHTTVTVTAIKSFDHTLHAQKGTCQACHADAGHDVTDSALKGAGVFIAAVTRTPLTTPIAVVGRGSADLPGHVQVACTRCHDLQKTGCPTCHTPPHKPRGDCAQCHKPAVKWVFTHPTEANCQLCHQLPAKHFTPASIGLTPCTRCHTQPGKSWKFTHPAASADCTTCHAVPGKHFKPVSADLKPCAGCHHQPGVSWKFTHPGAGADCQSCHERPANHSPGQCSACHTQAGVSFSFSHPSVPAPHGIGVAHGDCTKCHPNDYTTHSCTCHGGGTPG